jgi:hypothetical protein
MDPLNLEQLIRQQVASIINEEKEKAVQELKQQRDKILLDLKQKEIECEVLRQQLDAKALEAKLTSGSLTTSSGEKTKMKKVKLDVGGTVFCTR